LLISAWFAALVCGGQPQGGLGVFLFAAGIVIVAIPPRQSANWLLWAAGVVVVVSSVLALLPVGGGTMPAWRSGLASSGLFSTLTRISVVPEETAFWVGLLACSIVVALYLLSQPVRSPALIWFAAGAALLCATVSGLAMYALATKWTPFFHGGADFGFFPNRNHTATWLVTGCLAGIAAVAGGIAGRKFLAAVVGGVSLTVCAWPLLLVSPSRGGVVFLLAGVVIWIAGLGRRAVSPKLAITMAALIGAALLFLLGTQNPVRDRLENTRPAASPGQAAKTDGRILIYKDTMRMIADFPLTGAGIGTYKYIYPQYADASLDGADAIHPESDWLMLAAESGPLAVVGVIGALILLLANLRGGREHSFWPLRWGMICAAIAGMLHGLVDVPLHRVELGWWIMLLGALGFARPEDENHPLARRLQHIIFILTGICMIVLGTRLIGAQWFKEAPLPPFAPEAARQEILQKVDLGDLEETLNFARQQTRNWPMSYALRYQHGCLAMGFVELDRETDEQFAAALMLQPRWWRLAMDEGARWLEYDDPARAAGFWWEALRRRSAAGQDGGPVFRKILGMARQNPQAIALMMPPPSSPADFHFSWLEVGPEAQGRFARLSEASEFTDQLTEKEREKFFSLWFTKGDRAALEEFLGQHPDWEDAAWAVRIRAINESGDDEGAARRLAHRFGISLELPRNDVPEGSLDAEFTGLISVGNVVAARRILQEAAEGNQPGPAAEARRLQAILASQAGDWKTVYVKLVELLKASKQIEGGEL